MKPSIAGQEGTEYKEVDFVGLSIYGGSIVLIILFVSFSRVLEVVESRQNGTPF